MIAALAIGGLYRPIKPPVITGKAVPGGRVSCAPGQWEGSPSSYEYEWISQIGSTVVRSRNYTVGDYDEGALTCIVTAHYGAIAVPAEVSVRVPVSPQPTLCPRRPVALVSVRRGHGSLLLFGAAAPRHFGERVFGLRRGSHRRWRRVAAGRVNGSGYFELRAPVHGAGAGSYRVAIGRAVSNMIDTPGVLQIASDRSKPAESRVTLRVTRAGVLKVWRLNGCEAAESVTSATLAAGGRLHVRLPGGREPVAYLAQEDVGDRRYTVELIVPPRRSFRPVPID